MPIHRGLAFGGIAAALTAGVLTSAFVRPEARLAAAESCYGPCSSDTVLSQSRAAVFYGDEQADRFRVIVLPGYLTTGTPTGTVAVKSRATTLCTITLDHGSGSCSPTADALPAGFYKVVAVYGGDSSFRGSTSEDRSFLVFSGLRRRVAAVVRSSDRLPREAARER